MSLRPKKSLGQNFLHDRNIINKIISVSKINSNDEVLEVGPGTGTLTKFIVSQKPKKVYVIEKDENLANALEKQYLNKVEVIKKDILKIPNEFYYGRKFLIFGNLPYNISTKILSNLCLNKSLKVSKMILMFQKEVAERILADVNSKEYSRITILSKWKFDIKRVTDVKPNSFFPRPKVHSTVLEFAPKKKVYKIKDPENLEKITRIFFSQRRKMIKKPINILFKKIPFNYKKFSVSPSDRPQNIDINKYLRIVNEYENLGN
ncbi:16S rRNA (adenine(1518)-N(6)/adenine(1519)-N(6))-dimethyltransferase RsmA [Candidatus Pelagibacter sp.]|nr:16S rRNA (adenine(1518)-N(6)/adenine(1519)-N(6))-dimethyltransferase RsmA [Candidatus Pelagibacter sp.]